MIFAFYVGRGTWRDQGIRFFTWSRYSHVELITDAELKPENWTVSASKRDGGVREKLITWKPGHWEFVLYPVSDGEAAYIIERALKHVGAGYDTLGALMTVTPFHWHSKVNWFCSEHMANAVGHEEPHRLTPRDFHRLLMSVPGTHRVNVVAQKTNASEAQDE